MSTAITPFQLAIEDQQLRDLKQRLALTRWPDRQTSDGWSQGVPLDYMRELCTYWVEDYDWYRWQDKLNSYPQFKTRIDEVGIHFIHLRSPHADALPLLMTHGWPGSIVEFHKVMAPLTNPTAYGGNAADAFHLVCPTLPGFGFSDKPKNTGWNVQKIGQAWDTLMARLGYQRYVAQGGDWGAMVTTSIAQSRSERCAGIHLNMPIAGPDADTMDQLTPQEQSALKDAAYYNRRDSAYAKQQSTRPQTLGYGLADSPSGQAAWIIEKFYAWTDCGEGADKHPENVLSKDELLDNVMMYWLSDSAASSARIYWESFRQADDRPVELPVGCSIFPREIFRCSQRWAQKRFPQLVYWNELDKGGHFAAFEQATVFIDELRKCFRLMR
jgi:pimeloyl-ACP methyl ester carboxylesterase